jgi:hypothetical protein
MHLLLNPANLIVIAIFLVFSAIFINKVVLINKSLKKLVSIFKSFSKNELFYRFQELNDILMEDPFISDYWKEFKDTLIFENTQVKSGSDKMGFESVNKGASNILCTSDANYFFNEETLVHRTLNHKLISSIPGLLTGLGPLGTFLFIAIGFSGVDFTTEESTVKSITALLTNIEIASSISILAISSALIFTISERIIYQFFCKRPLTLLQLEINRLFDRIPAEKILIDLINESKRQNNALNESFTKLSDNFVTAIENTAQKNITPYLENIIYSLNQQKEMFSKTSIDKLFE